MPETVATVLRDERFVLSTDARATLRAWAGNGSVDLGAWIGPKNPTELEEREHAYRLYAAVREMLRRHLGDGSEDILVSICRVEDDPSGERAPYSSVHAVIVTDSPMSEWRPI